MHLIFRFLHSFKVCSWRSLSRQVKRGFLCFLCLLTLQFTLLGTIAPPSLSSVSAAPFQQATQHYQAGRYADAIVAFQQAAQIYQQQGAPFKQAAALSNLSLAYQQLGLWDLAQTAIAESFRVLNTQPSGQASPGWTQALEIQGGLQLAMGQSIQALETWQRAETIYRQQSDPMGVQRTQLNQAKAWQVRGFYRRALTILEQLQSQLASAPSSLTKAITLRSLGDTLQLTGDFARAEPVLQESLAIAQALSASEQISATFMSLGNTARAQQNPEQALDFYQQAAATAPTQLAQVQALANQFSLLNSSTQQSQAIAVLDQLQAKLPQLPPSRPSTDIQINIAQTAIAHLQNIKETNLPHATSLRKTITTLLDNAIQQSQKLKDDYTRSYALGTLGLFQIQEQELRAAQRSTEQALVLAHAIQAPDSLYQWQWQLGRIFKAQGKLPEANASYQAAIATLQSLRTNLAAINREGQFDFRDRVEPVYREAVALLLTIQKTQPSEQNLEQARQLMDQLQLAELDNFFREACVEGQQVVLDQLVDRDNPTTAILYPIILEQELQVIVKIPQQPLRNYAIAQSQKTTETTLQTLRKTLVQPSGIKATQRLSQQVYRWLIQPIESDLKQSGVNTLVFVLDGEFRNLPIAALYDGQRYLIETYAVALSTGLQLLQPRTLAKADSLNAIAAGLTQPPDAFKASYSPLPEVATELALMQQSGMKMQVLQDQIFQRHNLAQALQSRPAQIVHLATHGKFSSRADDTYILAADGAIYVREFDTLLRDRDQVRREPIELLTLSACQTATGDPRATLGLAGVALRAGARSTLASLWQVDDRATAILMGEFYRQLTTAKVSKAEALRRAQIALLKSDTPDAPNYQWPLFWAAYVLVGNWL